MKKLITLIFALQFILMGLPACSGGKYSISNLDSYSGNNLNSDKDSKRVSKDSLLFQSDEESKENTTKMSEENESLYSSQDIVSKTSPSINSLVTRLDSAEIKLKPLTAEGDFLLFENPDRGFRSELTWYATEAVSKGKSYTDWRFQIYHQYHNHKEEPIKLIMVYMYITDYRDTFIDDEGMEAIQLFFDTCRDKRVKIMLRIGYCDDMNYTDRNANQETMIRHIHQLSDIIKKNVDVVHSIQDGFIGAYCEWHSQVPPVDRALVLNNIMRYLVMPGEIYFQARLPEYKNLIETTSRYYKYIGFHNDAMFGAQRKKGWESGNFQLGNPNGQWEQVISEGYATPQDGEMFVNCNLFETNRVPSGMEIINELVQHRHTSMSFWHGYKDQASNEKASVMYRWKSEYVTENLLRTNNIVYCPSWFKDAKGNKVERNAFEFIRDHLGYKLEADRFTFKPKGKDEIDVSMSLRNYGFSAVFHLESGFALLDDDYKVISEIPAGTPTSWHSHSPTDYTDDTVLLHNLNAVLNLPKKDGKYYIAFYLKNTMNDYARLSNKLETADGYNILYEFNIDK